MPAGRRSFQRPLGERRYRKLFVVAVEGMKTEPQYFDFLKDQQSTVCITCLKGRYDSSPPQVLKRMKAHLQKEKPRPPYEAWLVVDKDQWTNKQLNQLYAWTQEQDNFGLALSNPKFEYWLLLHFEDGHGIASSRDCDTRLNRHFPSRQGRKKADLRKLTREHIDEAIRRARKQDHPPCEDWPRTLGGTTIYRLVANILQA